MKHLPLRECGYAIAFIVALVLLYGGAYLAMMTYEDIGSGRRIVILEYRFGGERAEYFFAPAHEIDRRLRPDLWRFEMSRTAAAIAMLPELEIPPPWPDAGGDEETP
jgi:hypothetical protein